ncbi:MAG: hypothetical protein MR935_00995 [Agathobaculum sp.]|uniref:DUF6933 domain-containing protein n=1 Tax=Agathobaculum sp. TaxID=2048138 RepID=UPI0025BBB2AA|nr:hypothetical protein [Agathobaculum sp.]MCI7124770.1 hypothetical protein [Agathobaculum sp.]
MELGLTIPLQRQLRYQAPPPYGTEADRRFCWDIHVITLRGRASLLAVHCHSRYAFVLFDLPARAWADLPGVFFTGLRRSFSAAGLTGQTIESYLDRAGACVLTRTHGRREVAFLNRAWDDVLALDYCMDESSTEQPLLDHAVNRKPSRCVGFDGLAPAAERLAISLEVRT